MTKNVTAFAASGLLGLFLMGAPAFSADCVAELKGSRSPAKIELQGLKDQDRDWLKGHDKNGDGAVSRDEYIVVCNESPERYQEMKTRFWAK